jgi:antitoxin YefM
MDNTIGISDARANLPELVTKISEQYDRAVITVNGKPKAVLLSIEELEAIEESAKILAIPHITDDIKKSREQIKKGEFTSLADIK